jgi:hypothetical protein
MRSSNLFLISTFALKAFTASFHEFGVDSTLVIPRQIPDPSPCRLNYTTDVWTSCADVIAQFEITLAQFLYANPQLGEGCDGFKPGEKYCVFRCG